MGKGGSAARTPTSMRSAEARALQLELRDVARPLFLALAAALLLRVFRISVRLMLAVMNVSPDDPRDERAGH